MGTAVASGLPDNVAVGAGVLVTVGRVTAVNFESEGELLTEVGCKAATKEGVGFSGTCSKSIWEASKAISTVRITPLVISKLPRQFRSPLYWFMPLRRSRCRYMRSHLHQAVLG